MGFNCREYKFRKNADLVIRQIHIHQPYLPNTESQKQLAHDVGIPLEELLRVLDFLLLHKYLDAQFTYNTTGKWKEIERNGGLQKAYLNDLSPWAFIMILLTFIVSLVALLIKI